MAPNVKIAVTSFGTIGPWPAKDPDLSIGEQNLERAIALLETAGRQHADLTCLPETFMLTGMSSEQMRTIAEPIPGPAYQRVAEQAQKHSMNVVAGFVDMEEGTLWNVAVVIDREGTLIGTYRKQFPTPGEIGCGVQPGNSQSVFETDIGRIGLAICFDINWPSVWDHFEAEEVDLVCWISAYDGGFPLRSYAWTHEYPIATSVMSEHARVIDISGEYLASTSRWTQLEVCEMNLDKRLFHIDDQAEKVLDVQRHYGPKVRIQAHSEENVFSIESLDEELLIEEIMKAHSLVDRRTYIQNAESLRLDALQAGSNQQSLDPDFPERSPLTQS